MKVPGNVSADKLILDYLARVAEAGTRYLPKGARMAFVGKTKAMIERECGAAGMADPTQVMEFLAELGDPEELVRQERARIDAEWVKRRAQNRAVGEVAATEVTAPREHWRITSRWKPATDTRPLHFPVESPAGQDSPPAAPAQPAGSRPGSPQAAAGGTGPEGAAPPASCPDRPVSYPVAPRGAPPLPRKPPLPTTPPAPAAAQAGPPDGGEAETAAPSRPGRVFRLSGADLAARAGAGSRMARRHPLEALAIILTGVGGVILPFPFWLLGGFAAVMSRLYDVRDKWIAFGGPLLLALAGSVLIAFVVGGNGNPVVIYFHALQIGVGYLVRAGCLLAGWHLARRLREGPRERVPPWRR